VQDRSPARSGSSPAVRSWPLLVLALPAAVAVWSGRVGIGQLTGFGQVHPLPGIWDSFHLNTAVTLPVGVEAYAAYAPRAWLSAPGTVSARTRRFARQSATASLLLGMAGQVAFHLLAQARTTRAPWPITTTVSCLPVLVLGMGAALAHLLRADTHPDQATRPPTAAPTARHRRGSLAEDGSVWACSECRVHPCWENLSQPPPKVPIKQSVALEFIWSGSSKPFELRPIPVSS
jgi:hypothetical protein